MADITAAELYKKTKVVGDCWIWQGSKNKKGYGNLKRRKNSTWPTKHMFAHRLSFLFSNGPLVDGLQVCHTCDTPACINPAHLFLGTNKENAQDSLAKGRHYQATLTHCQRGHEFTPENTRIGSTTGKRLCKTCAKAQWTKDNERRRNKSKNPN